MKETEAKGIRLIAVDLDGTLLTSDKSLAPEGARLLKKAARDGKHVVLATNRTPDSVVPLSRTLAINAPIICTNGAQVWGSPDGPVWAYHSIPQEAALAVAKLADEHNWELITTVGRITYWRQRPSQTFGPTAGNIEVVASNADAVVGDPVRMLTWNPDAADGIRELCRSELADQCYTETFYNRDGTIHALGIFALQADKGKALDLVLERLSLRPHQVMAIGDNMNDLPMFAHAQVSVAMGNAPDDVKRNATIVAPSNDREGVAWALRAYGVV